MLKSSSANFTLYPLLWLSVCFAVGILTATFFSFDWKIYLITCIFFLILSVVFLKQKFTLIFISIAFTAVGGLHSQIENRSVPEIRIKRIYDEGYIKSGDPLEIEGVLESKPELAVGGFFLILKTERAVYKNTETVISGRVKLFASIENEQIKDEYEQLNLQYGSRIRVACNLRREDNYLNAGVASQKKLLDQQEIDATGIIKSPLLVEKIADTETFAPLAWLYERRQNSIIDFRDKFNASTAGVLIASLLGNQYFLDKQTADIFRTGGTFTFSLFRGCILLLSAV